MRTIILPGGYRSEEDFNPGAYIPARSLRSRSVCRLESNVRGGFAPLKFDRTLTPELLRAGAPSEYEGLKAKFDELKKALPPQYPYSCKAPLSSNLYDLQLNIRGNPEQLGEVVPRRFPLVLSGGKTMSFSEGSGRLQLADTVAHHPLAAVLQ